jgi:protein SCO1/2
MRWLASLLVVVACIAFGCDAGAFDPRLLTLVDQRGVLFTLGSLRGSPTVVTFVASRCRDTCPISDAVFSQLATRLEREHFRATLVTITLDPDYDTPFVMSQAAREFAATAPRWRFASGNPRDIRAIMGAFGVITQKGADGLPDVHSAAIYILDAQGRLARATLLSTDAAAQLDGYLRQRRARR